jgi:hypothetical protein
MDTRPLEDEAQPAEGQAASSEPEQPASARQEG